jgi:hypothetical protein
MQDLLYAWACLSNPLSALRQSLAFIFRRTDAVQTHLRVVAARLFVIPKLDTFQGASAQELKVPDTWQNPLADSQFLRSAILEANHQPVKKDRFAANPQLNGAKLSVPAGNQDPAMVLAAVHLCVTQEVPELPAGKQ